MIIMTFGGVTFKSLLRSILANIERPVFLNLLKIKLEFEKV